MPLKSYGVLVGKCVEIRREDEDTASPHVSLFIQAGGQRFRAAINVKSSVAPSEVVYYFAQDFRHPVLERLVDLPEGFNKLAQTPSSGALDYIRGNLFPFQDVIALPANLPGLDNDLSDIVESLARRAIDDAQTRIFVFGEPFPDGIHDVHMNQGNVRKFERDDGVWQDGGLMIHSPGLSRWSAVFLAFQSQAIHTDDQTGHLEPGSLMFEDIVNGRAAPVKPAPGEPLPDQPLPDQPGPEQPKSGKPLPEPGQGDRLVRIVSAMVNPQGMEGQPGFAGEGEWVQLINLLPQDVELGGWAILNRNKGRSEIEAGTVLPGAGFLRVAINATAPLGNSGGLITLVDAQGLKVDGVSYTAAAARREGFPMGF
ncbi:DUF2278 family protein [Rhizobium deserti]|uniref:DUF2278 family protein n=1 Tax=Rhizobium deserti TaxID=2547961 RepID=A0A4R5UPP5_9HYPH|nr:DUF2278 family protein [Rhizobium deserti]TDK39764.1 DUF2278 family protein [Rhizobium deserti]